MRNEELRTFNDDLTYVEHHSNRNFIKIYELLLEIDRSSTFAKYLYNVEIKNLRRELDILNNLSRTSLIWVVEYELATHVQLLLSFEVNSNQIRSNLSDFSLILHFALTRFYSQWMNSIIESIVR